MWYFMVDAPLPICFKLEIQPRTWQVHDEGVFTIETLNIWKLREGSNPQKSLQILPHSSQSWIWAPKVRVSWAGHRWVLRDSTDTGGSVRPDALCCGPTSSFSEWCWWSNHTGLLFPVPDNYIPASGKFQECLFHDPFWWHSWKLRGFLTVQGH